MDQNVGNEKLSADARRALEVRRLLPEAERALSEPAELFAFLNAALRSKGQEELSEQRIKELTSPEAQRGLHEKHEAAKNAAAQLEEVPERQKNWKSPDDMGIMVRIVPAFMEPEEREGAKERNAAFLESLKTPEGKRELAVRALDMVEKTDEAIFLERDADKAVKNVGDNPELMTFAFVFDALTTYMKGQADLDGRLAESLGQRKTLWETGGSMSNLVKNRASPLYELLGGLTMEENLRIQSALTGGKTLMDSAKTNVLSKYFTEQMSTEIFFQEDEMSRAGKMLAERGLLTGDMSFRDASGKLMTHEDGLKTIGKGKQVTLTHYDSAKAGEGLSYSVTMQNGSLTVSDPAPCSRTAIPDMTCDPKLAALGNEVKKQDPMTFMDDLGVREVGWKEGLRKLADGEETCIRKTDGSLMMVKPVPDPMDRQKTVVEGRKVTELQLHGEQVADDSEKLLDFFDHMLREAGKEPFSEERKRELLSDRSRDAIQKNAAAAQEAYQEMRRYQALYSCPKEGIGLQRLAHLMLEPPVTPEADARNRAMMESLKTPEGRRELFYRGLDYLEREGEGRLLERDTEKMLGMAAEKPEYAPTGFVVGSTLMAYLTSEDGMDMPPQYLETLKDRLSVYEEGGDISNDITFMARKAFPLLSGMTEEETLSVLYSFSADKSQEDTAVVGVIANAIQERLGYRQDKSGIPLYRAGKQLEEAGLLTGFVVFRDEDGNTMDHKKAIERLGSGDSITLEQYADRKTPEGLSYRVTPGPDGLELQAEACVREIVTDPPFDARKYEINQALKNMGNGMDMTVQDSEGNILDRRAAVAQLAAGNTLTVTRYNTVRDYVGQQEKITAAPDPKKPNAAGLVSAEKQVCTRTVELSKDVRNAGGQLAELTKLREVLKKSDPFYVRNSPEFNQLMASLDKTVRFQRDPEKAKQKPAGTLGQLYAELDAKVDAYLRMKPDKMKQRTDADERGHLRLDTIRSLKSLTKAEHAAKMAANFDRELARQQAAPQQAAPQQKKKPEAMQL